MSDIPRWRAGELDEPGETPEPGPEVKQVFHNLPVTMHLGDPKVNTIIGWSNAWQNADGTATIVMSLNEEDAQKLGDLSEAFKLWAIGFAGVARRPASE